MKQQQRNFRIPVNFGFTSVLRANTKCIVVGCTLLLFLMVDLSLGLSPANAISIEVDNNPLINDKNSGDNANEKKQSEKSEKDVVVIYGSSFPSSSSYSNFDDNPTTLSSQSPNHQNQPSIQTITVGEDGIFPSKWIGLTILCSRLLLIFI